MDAKPKIGMDFLNQIRKCRERRDLIAKQVGAAQLETDRLMQRAHAEIARSLADEKAITYSAVRAIGIDPEKVDGTIDVETGEVIIEQDVKADGV